MMELLSFSGTTKDQPNKSDIILLDNPNVFLSPHPPGRDYTWLKMSHPVRRDVTDDSKYEILTGMHFQKRVSLEVLLLAAMR